MFISSKKTLAKRILSKIRATLGTTVHLNGDYLRSILKLVGYSFKNCEKYSEKILDNIKNGKEFKISPKKRYLFLDKILLGVLSNYNYQAVNLMSFGLLLLFRLFLKP